jgi:hypothetical protein
MTSHERIAELVAGVTRFGDHLTDKSSQSLTWNPENQGPEGYLATTLGDQNSEYGTP